MELDEAKDEVIAFYEEEFELDGLKEFYMANRKAGYKIFKENFIEHYGDGFLLRLGDNMRVSLVVAGFFKEVMASNSLVNICIALSECAETIDKADFEDEAEGFYDLICFLKGTGDYAHEEDAVPEVLPTVPEIIETPGLNKSWASYINKEVDQTRSIEDSLKSINPMGNTIYLSEPTQEPSSKK
ncbi:hypothetical protein ACFLZB_05000 [Nanoarchaeota archaeon]